MPNKAQKKYFYNMNGHTYARYFCITPYMHELLVYGSGETPYQDLYTILCHRLSTIFMYNLRESSVQASVMVGRKPNIISEVHLRRNFASLLRTPLIICYIFEILVAFFADEGVYWKFLL